MSTATDTGARVGEYEVMFLASQGSAAQLGDLIEHLEEIISRANGEFISLRKWDERRLAYEIDKQKRGVYFLAYVRCPGDMVGHIERDVTISDRLMRVLITKADHLTLEEMTSHDQRAELATEAKLRREEGDAQEEKKESKVRIGAPEIAAKPEEAPAEAAAEAPADGDAPGTEG